MTVPYVRPQADLKAFNCPFCGAYAHFYWSEVLTQSVAGQQGIGHKAAMCSACGGWTLWALGKVGRGANAIKLWGLVHPASVSAPLAHPAMPAECQVDFEEARKIAAYSPRAAAALLRLCVERLCQLLNAKGRTLNDMIGDLVTRGLAVQVQQALDIVRVTGDKSIHAGTINPGDDPAVAASLFGLVNEIVDEMFAKPQRIAALYEKLSGGTLQQIDKRDGGK